MIYLDHNATSPPNKEHLERLLQRLLTTTPANPSSPHSLGRKASVTITEARKNVAATLGIDAKDLIFTSGGTEANNCGTLAVVAEKIGEQSNYKEFNCVTSSFEHPCILKSFERIKHNYGGTTQFIKPNNQGFISVEDVIKSLNGETILLSLMAANNEIGTIQPVKIIGDFLHYARWNILCPGNNKEYFDSLKTLLDQSVSKESLVRLHFHIDAVQIYGKVKQNFWMSEGFDSVAISAHKIGALTGVGGLFLRRGRKFLPPMCGGAQEKNRRPGTENLPGITSFGMKAEELLKNSWWDLIEEKRILTHTIFNTLSAIENIKINSQKENGLYNTIHVSFLTKNSGEDIITQLDMKGICTSSGSACSSGANLPSHVALAIGHNQTMAKNSLRISLGFENTEQEIRTFLTEMISLLNQ